MRRLLVDLTFRPTLDCCCHSSFLNQLPRQFDWKHDSDFLADFKDLTFYQMRTVALLNDTFGFLSMI